MELIDLDPYDRLSGLYIIGATGTGKSTQLIQLILENIKNGDGVCVLDPHGTMIDELLEHAPDLDTVILLDLTDQEYVFGLNLFACPDTEQIDEWVAHVLRVFGKVWGVGGVKVTGWGATLEDLLRNIANTMIDNPGMTLTEVPLLLRNEDVRAKLIKNVSNPDVRYYWDYDYNKLSQRGQLEDSDSTLNKVRSFLSYRQIRGIVGQSKTTINMREIMDSGKTLFVKLDTRNDDTTTLIGTMLMAEIVSATYSRKQRDPFFIYADEFQRFATSDFARMFAEARKFGVAVTVSHQFRDQLDLENRSATLNAGNLVVFRVSGKDAEELAPEFSHLPEPERLERIEEEVTDMVEEEVKAPTPDPLGHLRHHSHGNPLIDGYIQQIILPLFETFAYGDSKRYDFAPRIQEEYLYHFGFSMWYKNWQQAEVLLNRLMIDAMAGILDFSSPNTSPTSCFYQLTELLILLRAYFRFQDSISSSTKRVDREAYVHCMQTFFTPNADTTSVEHFVLQNWENGFLAAAWDNPQYPSSLAKANGEEFMPLVRADIHGFVQEAQHTFQSLIHFLECLESDPLLVTTGQKRLAPRTRTQVHYIQHPQRPYSDTKNQTAEELAKQPNYTARYRTLDGEGTVYVAALDRGDYINEEQAIKRNLIAEGILRRRSDVEEEIKARQTKLLTPDEPDTVKNGEKPTSRPKTPPISPAKPYP